MARTRISIPLRSNTLALLIASLAIAGCATARSSDGATSSHELRGAYAGRLIADGARFDGALSLRTDRRGRVTGTLRLLEPFRIDGSVRGNLIDDLLRITITYRNAEGCDGSIEGILTVQPGGEAIDGPVTLSDCAEPIAGSMAFRR